MNRFVHYLWIFTFLLLLVQAAIAWPDMPGSFATHFDGEGNPNGWMEKIYFFPLWIFTVVAANVAPLFTLIAPDSGVWKWILDKKRLSIINRDYWFSTPERIAQIPGKILFVTELIILLVNAILYYAFDVIYRVATTGEGAPDATLIITAVIVIIVVSLAAPFIVFRKTE